MGGAETAAAARTNAVAANRQPSFGELAEKSHQLADAIRPGTEEFAKLCRELDNRGFAYRFVKRLFDIVFSIAVIAVFLIPGLILSVAIAIDTKGTPIYTQARVGKRGLEFKIFKLRTMVSDSDDVEKYFTPEQLEIWKRERKVEDDPRITKLGSILRRISVDEFPQFINVLLGQISVIGPRVITYDELEWFGDDAADLLSVPPGITGLWQVGERNNATFESGVRQTIELSYVDTASPVLDLKIVFRTIKAIAERAGK